MIHIKNLSYRYKTYERDKGFLPALKDFFKRKYSYIDALKGISLDISKGDIVGLLGPNGAGKSTMIKVMVGILKPLEGEVVINNMIPFERKKNFLRDIGVVFGQKSQLAWDLPPQDTLLMLKEIYGISGEDFAHRMNEMSRLLAIKDKLKIPVRKLSLGERMKFELMCSLLHRPQLLFLDEPTIGLDIASQRSIYSFLKSVNSIYNTTIILTSHYIKDIESLCERVIILKEGEKVVDTGLDELLAKYTFPSTYIIESHDELSFYKDKKDNFIEKIKGNQYRIVLPANYNINEFLTSRGITFSSLFSFKVDNSDLEEVPLDIYCKDTQEIE